MEAFTLALRLGATGLESDVWRTADGVLVLDHDGVVRRGLRRRPITATPRQELPPHIPDLAEVLDLCEGAERAPVALSLDLKGPGTGASVVDLIRHDFPDLVASVWCCHPDVDELAALRRLDDDIRLVNSTRLERIAEGPERRAARLNDTGIDGINLHHTDVNGGLAAMFHRFRRTLFAWDLQFEDGLRRVLRMGVDGVFSDWVDRMMDAYRAELGSPRLPDTDDGV
jgi:glycerophosphoryl diester phosphodiesterase